MAMARASGLPGGTSRPVEPWSIRRVTPSPGRRCWARRASASASVRPVLGARDGWQYRSSTVQMREPNAAKSTRSRGRQSPATEHAGGDRMRPCPGWRSGTRHPVRRQDQPGGLEETAKPELSREGPAVPITGILGSAIARRAAGQ